MIRDESIQVYLDKDGQFSFALVNRVEVADDMTERYIEPRRIEGFEVSGVFTFINGSLLNQRNSLALRVSALESQLADRDGEIKRLQVIVTDRDAQIASLKQVIANLNTQLQAQIQESE